jgi:hypothetical protein
MRCGNLVLQVCCTLASLNAFQTLLGMHDPPLTKAGNFETSLADGVRVMVEPNTGTYKNSSSSIIV